MRFLVRIAAVLREAPRPLAWLCFAAWTALIFYLSSLPPQYPGSESSTARSWAMNLRHAPEFGLFAVLFAWSTACKNERLLSDGRRLAWGILAVVAYGCIDERHQYYVPGRDASLCDILTNIAGGWFALALLRAIEDGAPSGRIARLTAIGVPACVLAAGIATLVPRHWPALTWL